MPTPATSTVPLFTPLPNGFISVQTLPDGRFVVESWWLNPTMGSKPFTQAIHYWIADDEADALGLIDTFTSSVAILTRNP